MSFVLKNQAQTELDDVNKKIASIQDIETIVKDYENAESVYVDAMSMYSYTKNLNENVVTFITALEEKMPKELISQHLNPIQQVFQFQEQQQNMMILQDLRSA